MPVPPASWHRAKRTICISAPVGLACSPRVIAPGERVVFGGAGEKSRAPYSRAA